jgi:N-acyl-D-aspartate/D-glutamate deacylase
LGSATYREFRDRPLTEQVWRLRSAETREAVLADLAARTSFLDHAWDRVFDLGDPPDYEPDPSTSLAARATAAGVTPESIMYDLMLGQDGKALLYLPVNNYFGGDLDAVAEMMDHPNTVPGLGDGGAHVGTICDASFATTLLTHWGRDRHRGRRFDLPWLVQRQCRKTAEAVGLLDRGLLAPGYKADLNVIDFDHLRLESPRIVHDLPAGGKRLLQRAHGYRHTVVSGVEAYRDGEPTGALPGHLVRGQQPDPVAEPDLRPGGRS